MNDFGINFIYIETRGDLACVSFIVMRTWPVCIWVDLCADPHQVWLPVDWCKCQILFDLKIGAKGETDTQCCMFRSRRSILVKRLWKYRIYNETGSTTESQEELELKSVTHSMLKRLKEKQLDALVESVESQGSEQTECVMLPKGEQRLGRKTVTPQVLCCKLWRWVDITNTTELKRLPCCTSVNDTIYQCCNPYHFSLITKPGELS